MSDGPGIREDGTRPVASPTAFGAPAPRSPNTIRAYRSDWRKFCEWARSRGLEALPADTATIGLYMRDLAGVAKVSTIARRLASIAHAHRAANWPSPTEEPAIRAMWADIRRGHASPSTSADPIGVPLLRRMVERLPRNLSGLRDQALLVVGFAGSLRRSQLVAIDVEHVATVGDGILLTVPPPHRRGGDAHQVALPPSADAALCPVRAVEAWRSAAQLSTGPLFRPVNRHGRVGQARLSPAGATRVVQRAVARTGVDARRFSAESLRMGVIR